ncbi:ErfK/YbiS/YcfS/YnhG family protein (modular protein) [Methylocella tundrae]|uniref:ErfK/YbiS/YcfS/YnhG family protein (Modular protein) n=1 Tax=Methylocella tundrae TaxID=227605 RepID=A0A8B6MB78_METTU|nr:L,D-transpeptidase [Methylocella tundrae]VTZ52297.1 ErfK/YbiS/YcfS/YnhG family protein (modular protein) [Methylocella tundrae]
MRRILGVCAFLCSLGCVAAAQARVRIDIDLSSQTMHVSADGSDYLWSVSTARSGYATPRGYYRSRHLERMHYSRKYHMSPMPHSIFFNGGYAIHGTYSTADLGRPASHGCIRLSPDNAAFLYGLVKEQGADIRISGSPPRAYAMHRWRRERGVARRQRPRLFEDDYQGWSEEAPDGLAYAPPRSAVLSRHRRVIDPVTQQPQSWQSWPR